MMRRIIYEFLGIFMVFLSLVFFYFSIQFMAERDYIAGILQVFIGFSLTRAGLELTKLSLLNITEQ